LFFTIIFLIDLTRFSEEVEFMSLWQGVIPCGETRPLLLLLSDACEILSELCSSGRRLLCMPLRVPHRTPTQSQCHHPRRKYKYLRTVIPARSASKNQKMLLNDRAHLFLVS
jgi:hypothetical protein